MIFPYKDITWEQRKVFEIADRFDNLRVPVAANLRISGNTPYYGANGIQDYVEGYTHDGEYILVAEDGASREFRSCKKYRILNRGLFTTFFMLIFVKFYVFIYRILLYSAI